MSGIQTRRAARYPSSLHIVLHGLEAESSLGWRASGDGFGAVRVAGPL